MLAGGSACPTFRLRYAKERTMRTISKRTQYGLKAVLNLASHYGEGPVLISSISEREGIPVRFLELILLHPILIHHWDKSE